MEALYIIALPVYTFGIYAFGSILLLEVGSHWRGAARPGKGSHPWDVCGLSLLVVSFLWFVVALATTLASLQGGIPDWPLRLASVVLLYLFPPLIVHTTYAETRRCGPVLRHPVWSIGLAAVWILSQASLALLILGFFDLLGVSARVLNIGLGVSITSLFAFTGVYCALALSRGDPTAQTRAERSSRRWMVGLFLFMLVLTLFIFVAHLSWAALGEVLGFLGSCLPLLFFFVAFYHEDRFEFFDLFIKRGAFLVSTIALLVALFAVLHPWMERLDLGPARPWIYVLLALPGAMALPWLHRRLGAFLDNVWLGRRFTTVQAVKHFLSELRGATDERDLVDAAQRGLSTIFHAPVRIDLGLGPASPTEFECAEDVPIVCQEGPVGTVRLGPRTNHAPYFSEDRALLGSLSDVLAYMLENVRLQERKQEHERRAKELSLHASRSELKALRAQVNPHFLFNALNAIAGLIHKDPLKADRTVEQLAEVFRYTLRGSQHEWSVLDDEMDFVRAYLDVEQARFGQRLAVEIEIDDSVRSVRIVTMMAQTLVENAVKHGIAAVREQARIRVVARRDGDRLLIEVADNGPGFDERTIDGRTTAISGSSGFGLKSIRQRLRGYFGDDASLAVRRDEESGMTVVAVSMPARHDLAPRRGVPPDAAGSSGVA